MIKTLPNSFFFNAEIEKKKKTFVAHSNHLGQQKLSFLSRDTQKNIDDQVEYVL